MQNFIDNPPNQKGMHQKEEEGGGILKLGMDE
jgi:hypothetical protein